MPRSPNLPIKRAAIPRAGYDYQDLVGIEILIRFFRDPQLFEWVSVEADDPETRSLDDVVAYRRDGTVELIQVKFTVDQDRFHLDWDWLLKKSERGTSLLKKWSLAFFRAQAHGPVHAASLRTNRVPSPQFLSHMEGNRVRLDRLDPNIRGRVTAECGGEVNAECFFESFTFETGLPDHDRLEVRLRNDVIPTDTDLGGWTLLREHVRRWATYPAEPSPDGRIRHQHLVQLLSRKRPKPIRQDFHVPEGYVPPNSTFNRDFLKRVVEHEAPLTVLWGTPGRGKSTYLSYLAGALEQKGPVIRHHYYLSLRDSTVDRTSFFDIANSLIYQMIDKLPEPTSEISRQEHDLRQNIELVANRLAARGQKLFLIVDGLDHVWRDTYRMDQLEYLFNTLLPLPEYVSLLIGTQRVDDAQLPKRLLVQATSSDWVEIPAMDQVAVHAWLTSQDAARPLLLKQNHHGDRDEQMAQIAEALWKVGKGHPLHLIFVMESLRLREKPIDVDSISSAPPCPEGDIRDYYNSLWVTLSADAKQILHALAGSNFAWPPSGIRRCFGDFTSIEFLLEARPAGFKLFHGSLFAWIRERQDHLEVFAGLLPNIVSWLKSDAPEAWRWAWLWITEARAGYADGLLAGATRDWAVDSLARGWSDVQIEEVFRHAEQIAFDRSELARTVALRSVKVRVSNAREYQAANYALFRAIAIAISDNCQEARNLLDRLPELQNDELIWLARLSPTAERAEMVDGCVYELARRINAWLALRRRQGDEFVELTDRFVECALLQGKESLARITHFIFQFKEPEPKMSKYISGLGRQSDFETLIRLRKLLRSSRWKEQRRDIDTEILRAALRLGRDPTTVLPKMLRTVSPFVGAWNLLVRAQLVQNVVEPPIPADLLRERYYGKYADELEQFFVDAFWLYVCRWVETQRPVTIYPELDRSAMGWMNDALSVLEDIASTVASNEGGFGFATPYEAAGELAPVRFSNAQERDHHFYIAFRKGLTRIAIDLHLLSRAGQPNTLISHADFEIARSSLHWSDTEWISDQVSEGILFLSTEAASNILEDRAHSLSSQVTEFMQRSAEWCELAYFAHIQKVGDPVALIRRSADCLLGYGYRKDLSAMEVLDAIGQLHSHDPKRTRGWLKAVTPVIDSITEFTDGDETDHVRSALINTVAGTLPEFLPAFHRHHIAREEWRYADDALCELLKRLDLEGPCAAALASTLIDPVSLGVLEDRSHEDPLARRIHTQQLDFLGGQARRADRDFRTQRKSEARGKRISVSRYPPKRLSEFMAVISESDVPLDEQRLGLRRWLEHWAGKGRTVEALAAIDAQFENMAPRFSLEEALDTAFRLSLGTEGKDAAFQWLVRAHISRYGWASYMVSEEETVARLQNAAEYYPERWLEFVKKTAVDPVQRNRRNGGPVIGQRYLVRFLLLVGQVERASTITDALISSLISEVQDQPIARASWLW